jgi:hypothetical protein
MQAHAICKALQVSLSEDRKHIVIRSDRGSTNADDFLFGIEEEYFLADAGSLEAALRTRDELFEAVNWSTGGHRRRQVVDRQDCPRLGHRCFRGVTNPNQAALKSSLGQPSGAG